MFKGKRFKQQSFIETNFDRKVQNNGLNINQKIRVFPKRRRVKIYKKDLLTQREQFFSEQKQRYKIDHFNNPQDLNQPSIPKQQLKKKVINSEFNISKIYLLNHNNYCLKIKQKQQQQSINSIMRIIVIDWLMELGHELEFNKQIMHTSIYYLDKLIKRINITKDNLQAYGLCCLMIAQKLQSQRYITPLYASTLLKGQYSQKDFILLEQQILKNLKFKLYPFTLWIEINILLKAFQIFFKLTLDQRWRGFKQRIFWIIEGIIMQNGYYQKIIIEKEIQFRQSLTKYYSNFLLNLNENNFEINLMQQQIKYLQIWIERKCECSSQYSSKIYHPELKIMAASCIYN